MRCLGPTPHCQRTAPCEHACALRVRGIPPTGPSDSQMLDWLAFNVPSIEQFRGQYRLSRLSSQLTGWHFGFRSAIRAAMKEAPDA